MKNLIYTLIVFLTGTFNFCANAVANNTPSLAFLQNVSNELNKGMPQKIDNEIELRTTFVQIGALGYMYVLVNYNADEIDSGLFLTKQSPQIKNFACTNPRMKRFFEDNVDLIYSYYGKDMKHVAEIVVTSADCNK